MSATAFSEIHVALMIGTIVFLASLFGILTRPTENMAAFWPANAVLLGLLLRVPRLATAGGWVSATIAFVLAGFIVCGSFLISIAWAASNVMSVAVAYRMYRHHDESIRRLKRSRAIPVLLLNLLAASVVAGVAAAAMAFAFSRGQSLHGGIVRFVTEAVNYIAILPVILAAPDMSWRWLERRRDISLNIDLQRSLPALAVFLSCAISMLLGGAAALAFPIPALLWCSVTYSVFTTALLTLGFSIWALLAIPGNALHFAVASSLISPEMSIRIGIAVLALVPISLAVVAEARNELMRRLLEIASRDQLTGLLNRHAFRERCNVELTQLGADKKPASLLMINIDHFRAVNETYGYAAGDRALASFSKVVSACLRNTDVFGRLGGEEFAVLLPDCERPNTQMVAERIRKAVAETPVDLGDNIQLAITASIGAASTALAPSDIEPLLLAADSALYRAKKSGRNKVMEGEFNQEAPHPLRQDNS